MKYVLLAKEHPASKKSLEWMIEKEYDILFVVLKKTNKDLRDLCCKAGIPTGTEEDLFLHLDKNRERPDYILSYYWKKAGKKLLAIANSECINFHPGPLPEARGSAYHIAILEGWGEWGVTAHFMDEEYDTGDIIRCERFPIRGDIVNQELVELTHKKLFELFRSIVEELEDGKQLERSSQGEGTFYNIHNIDEGKLVLPTDTEEMIDRKIRAYWNPPYSGASVKIGDKTYTVVNERVLGYLAMK